MELMEFGERLAQLRLVKKVSAREMSLSIGQSANYINKIENGITLPSMAALFDICDYLEISPKDFFDTENNNPSMVNEFITDYKRLDNSSQSHLAGLVRGIVQGK